MFYRRSQLTLLTILYLLGASISVAQTVRIEIKSSWDGLGTPSHGVLVISGSNGKYLAGGRTVSPIAIKTLLAALTDPQVKEPSIMNCGIDQTWLDSNYKAALEGYTHQKLDELSPKQVQLFKGQFEDLQHAQEALEGMFKGWHTDDFPKMSVTATVDGKLLAVESDSQHPFMLPWFGNDDSRGGYNCRISQAIAAILPKKFSNRGRLMPSESFRWALAAQVMDTIEDEWNLLDTEFKVGDEVAPIFALYSPIKSAVNCLSSIDVDHCKSWNAKLKGPTLPSNMIIGVSLPYDKKRLIGVQPFLNQIPEYVALVQSVPWLSTYMRVHPDIVFELRYVVDRSLSAKALSSLEEDLRKHGKSELAVATSEHAEACAFMEIDCGSGCGSRAVVLPNRNVLLWHFRGDSVLGFSEKELNTWEYYNWRSAGVMIKPDGALIK